MKHLIGIFAAFILLLILALISIFIYKIPEFIAGFFCAVGYFAGRDSYVEVKNGKE